MADSVIGDVPNTWIVATVGEIFKKFDGRIQTGPFGSQLHASDYVIDGIPTVMPANIGDNRIIEDGISRVGPEDVERLSRHKLQLGDIVFSRRGDVERRSLVRHREVGWLCGTGCLLVRPPSSYVDSDFLAHWFGHPVIRTWLTQHAIGATMLNLNTEILSSVPLVLPSMAEQKAISELLGLFDDKIEANNRIWRTRLAISVGIFEYLKSVAKSDSPLDGFYEQGLSGVWGEETNTNGDLIPTSCVRGRDIEDFIGGRFSTAPTRFISSKQLSTRRYAEGEIWTAGSGTLGPSMLMEIETANLWKYQPTYSNFVKRLVPTSQHQRFALCWHALDEWRRNGDFKNFQTGTAMPNLDVDALLKGVRVPVVSDEDSRRLAEATRFALNPGLITENHRLIELRDSLLPELLSGRLRVTDAESIVENV